MTDASSDIGSALSTLRTPKFPSIKTQSPQTSETTPTPPPPPRNPLHNQSIRFNNNASVLAPPHRSPNSSNPRAPIRHRLPRPSALPKAAVPPPRRPHGQKPGAQILRSHRVGRIQRGEKYRALEAVSTGRTWTIRLTRARGDDGQHLSTVASFA